MKKYSSIIEMLKDLPDLHKLVRGKLVPKDEDLMAEFVTKEFYGMMILYHLRIDKEDGIITIGITKELATTLGWDDDDIIRWAWVYAKPPMVSILDELLESMCGNPFLTPIPPIYVIGEKNHGGYGAYYMCVPMLLDAISEEKFDGGDFIIIPSSINEFLAIDIRQISPENAKWMLVTTNQEVVSEEDWLSDNILIWRAEKREIEIF